MHIQYNVMRFNTLFIIFTLDIKQCPIYMSLKNSLVETFSNNFPKLVKNSSNLTNVNHKCDGICISDINWYICCNFNLPFSLVSVSVEKIGVLVCKVCQIPKTTFNHISNTSSFAKYFPLCLVYLFTCSKSTPRCWYLRTAFQPKGIKWSIRPQVRIADLFLLVWQQSLLWTK